jgi:benzoate-CoA ligase family protein
MPQEWFNACEYLLDRRIEAGDGGRVAITGAGGAAGGVGGAAGGVSDAAAGGPGGRTGGVGGELTYWGLLDRVERIAAGLRYLGLQPEQRIVMLMSDGPDFVAVYLAAMRMGAIPVPVSTMLRVDGLAELLSDSRARLLAITPEFTDLADAAVTAVTAVTATGASDLQSVVTAFELATATPEEAVYPTTADSPAFWLYTSGTTGTSKAAMHRHGSVRVVCETYGAQVLGITPGDRCLSAAKAFFAYGLGNSVLFPLSVGACAVLEPAPSRPDLLVQRVREYGATLFFAGPTFFANMLRAAAETADPAGAGGAGLAGDAGLADDRGLAGVRLAVSAGEALPAALYERWTSHYGVDILDGIGMTEMLHIFLSNWPGKVRAGTTGVAVPGYDLKILDEESGLVVPKGQPGTLFVRGASTATGYWSRYDASRKVFQGEWLRTGDTYVEDADGYYTCLGRTGDMLKPSGIWVSPAEVEGRLLAHEAVAQAVVVAGLDADGLEKPVAYVVLKPGATVTEVDLVEFCRVGLPAVKRPRRIVFTDGYPTTVTGKVRRVDLRKMATSALTSGAGPTAAGTGPAVAGPGLTAVGAEPKAASAGGTA